MKNNWLLNLAKRALSEFKWETYSPQDNVLETYLQTSLSKYTLHIQVLDKINAVSIISTNEIKIKPDRMHKFYELIMYINNNLLIGAVEVNPLDRQLMLKQSNIFNNLVSPDSDNNGFVKNTIISLIEMNLTEMDIISALINDYNGLELNKIEELKVFEYITKFNVIKSETSQQ